ncbi:MAG: VWA domain-containing protein, partial [Desulfobacteraceae bacterium]|nr:VWA domain-containing protein [Desulfobacteraceae bacterium]
RSNLATTDLEWVQFRELLDQFWIRVDEGKKPDKDELEPGREMQTASLDEEFLPDDNADLPTAANNSDKKEWLEGVAYSPVSMVQKKDLGRFDRGDVQVAQLALKKMMEPFKVDISRRSKRGRKSGNIDFPLVIRKSLKTGGIPFELFYRQKKKRLKRLVILADVSGSMDRYIRFVMPFLLGLRGVGSRAEVFVFSTSLTPITFMVRHLDVEKALERIAMEVPDWSGGTRIGYSLHQFNQGHGERLLSRRTVVVLLSDGWDLGGKDLLRREMVRLSNRAYSVIWLNPLAGDPDYEPLCRGMKSALPYIDYFLPADSLHSLKRVGRLLSRIMIH